MIIFLKCPSFSVLKKYFLRFRNLLLIKNARAFRAPGKFNLMTPLSMVRWHSEKRFLIFNEADMSKSFFRNSFSIKSKVISFLYYYLEKLFLVLLIEIEISNIEI